VKGGLTTLLNKLNF